MAPRHNVAPRFDAFVSYSHDADHGLATLLSRRLERIATPWYRHRRLRIFCDSLTLGAQSLDETIRSALDDSRYLVVFASPEAAASRWVQAETEYWLAGHTDSAAHILIVLTAGTLRWNPAARSYEGDCLPRALLEPGVFDAERKWVDLSGADLMEPAGSQNPLGEAIAELAAELLGTTKDAVRGQEVTARLRARRALAAAMSVLVVFVGAVVALAVQLHSSGEQVTQRELVARSRSLAAAALGETAPDLAPLLAAQAIHEAPTQEAYDAVLKVLNRNPRLQVMRRVSGATHHSDDHRRVLAVQDDSVKIFDLRTGATSVVTVKGVAGAAMSSAGELAISTESQMTLWRAPFERPFATVQGTGTARYTLDGRYLVVQGSGEVRLLDATDGKAARPPLSIGASISACNSQVIATNDLSHLVVAGCHNVEVWDLGRRRVTARRAIAVADNTADIDTEGITAAALSPDGRYLALGTSMVPMALDGSVHLVETRTLEPVTLLEGEPVDLDLHDGAVEDITFDAGGRAVAIAASTPENTGGRSARFETLDLSDGRLDVLGPEWPGASAAIVQAGRSAGQFTSGDDSGLVAQWDAARSDRIGQVLWRGGGILVSAAATADGRTLAIRLAHERGSDDDPDAEVVTDLKTLIIDPATGITRVLERSVDTETIFAGGGADTSASPLLFSPDGRLLLSESGLREVTSGRLMYPAAASSGVFSRDGTRLLLGRSNGTVVLLRTTGSLAVQRVFRLPTNSDPDAPTDVVAMAFAADGSQVAAVSASGLVVRFDAVSAHVLSSWTPWPATTDVVPPTLTDAAFDNAGDIVALFTAFTGDVAVYGAGDVFQVSTGQARATLDEAVSRGTFVDPAHLLMANETRESLVVWGWAGEPVRVWMPLDRVDQVGTVKLLDREFALVGITQADTNQARIVRVPLARQALKRLACSVAGRDLTAAEKTRYLQRQGQKPACVTG